MSLGLRLDGVNGCSSAERSEAKSALDTGFSALTLFKLLCNALLKNREFEHYYIQEAVYVPIRMLYFLHLRGLVIYLKHYS